MYIVFDTEAKLGQGKKKYKRRRLCRSLGTGREARPAQHVLFGVLAGFALDVDDGLPTCTIAEHRRLPRRLVASRDRANLLEEVLVRSPLQN